MQTAHSISMSHVITVITPGGVLRLEVVASSCCSHGFIAVIVRRSQVALVVLMSGACDRMVPGCSCLVAAV